MQAPNNNLDTVVRQFFRRFSLLLLVSASLIGGLVYTFHTYDLQSTVGHILEQEMAGVALRKEVIGEHLERIDTDLQILSEVAQVQQVLSDRSEDRLEAVAQLFLDFVRENDVYDQIRLIDAKGMELVRVNHNSGLPVIVDSEDLQFKGFRYYFKDTSILRPGEIYVSPMDLNIEQGAVEIPFKPMIRFGVPLYGENDELACVLVVNYMADQLLGLLRKTGDLSQGQTMLVNREGYWLLAPNAEDQWGFMFPERQERSFARRYPDQWEFIRARDRGQIAKGDTLASFVTIKPINEGYMTSSGASAPYGESDVVLMEPAEYYWKLISFVPNTRKYERSLGDFFYMFFIGAAGGALVGVLAWGISLFLMRDQFRHLGGRCDLQVPFHEYESFSAILQNAVKACRSNGGQLALLRIRFDEYESIIDDFSVETANDILLQMVVRIRSVLPENAIVSRFESNELGILLEQIEDREAGYRVVSQCRQSLAEPFVCKGITFTPALSIGIALCPEDGEDIVQLKAAARLDRPIAFR